MRTKQFTAGLFGIVLTMGTIPAVALELLSEDFESPSSITQYTKGQMPDNGNWQPSTQGFGATDLGMTDKAGGDFSAPDPNHQAMAFRKTNQTGITSKNGKIGSLEFGRTYTVTFDAVWDEGDTATATEYNALLIAFDPSDPRTDVSPAVPAGDLKLVQVTGNCPNDGSFETISFSVTADSVTHAGYEGYDIGVRFIGSYQSALIDNIVVSNDVAVDITPPVLTGSDIVDDSGDGTNDTYEALTYTVTFSEEMDPASITTDDFSNSAVSSPATITVDSVTQTDTNVFTVVVMPTSVGDLILNVSSNVTDLQANPLATDVDDDTTIKIVADTTPPTVTSMTSDQDGEPNVTVDLPVTYTVAFSEMIDASTVTVGDFANASTATISVDSVAPASDTNVFIVVVTPTSTGSLQLELTAGSVTDLSGVPTSTAETDDTVLTVVGDTVPPEVLSFVDDRSGQAVGQGTPVTYTVTFNEDVLGATVDVGDFVNASTASITVDSVGPATDTSVYTVSVTPTSGGDLQLRLKTGAVTDLVGNTNNAPWTDDTTIAVVAAADANGTWNVDADGTWSEVLNWLSNTIANGTDSTATFPDIFTANRVVTLDSSRTIGGLSFDATGGDLQISGADPLTLDVTTGVPEVNVSSSLLTIGTVIEGNDGLSKSGAGQLTLPAANTFVGDLVINAGTVQVAADSGLGAISNDVVFTASSRLITPNGTTLGAERTLSVASNAVATLGPPRVNSNHTITMDGNITGGGGIHARYDYVLGSLTMKLLGTGHDFAGPITIGTVAGSTVSSITLEIASLADGPGYGNVTIGPGRDESNANMTFKWSASAVAPLVLNNRQVDLATARDACTINNSNTADGHANTVSINTDLIVSEPGNKTLVLRGSNAGDNRIAGSIPDGPGGSVINVSKADGGTWVLAGNNTYSGATTVIDGTLVLQGGYCLPDTGTLSIDSDADSNGKVELYANEKVGALELGGVPQASGTYGSTDSNAENQDDTYFAGPKVLYVGVDLPPTGTVLMMQ